jgi:hypothetical protein
MNKKEKFNNFCTLILGEKENTLCDDYAELNEKNEGKNKEEIKEEINTLKLKLEKFLNKK